MEKFFVSKEKSFIGLATGLRNYILMEISVAYVSNSICSPCKLKFNFEQQKESIFDIINKSVM